MLFDECTTGNRRRSITTLPKDQHSTHRLWVSLRQSPIAGHRARGRHAYARAPAVQTLRLTGGVALAGDLKRLPKRLPGLRSS